MVQRENGGKPSISWVHATFSGEKSSDPHPETLFWHSFWMFLTYHLEVYMAYSFWHATVIYCIYCIWHLFWHTFWHLFWHSFWHSIWRLFWHSIWHLFRHSFWHLYRHSDSLWHSFWHSIISGIYSYIFSVAFYLTFSLASGGGPAAPTQILSMHSSAEFEAGGGEWREGGEGGGNNSGKI